MLLCATTLTVEYNKESTDSNSPKNSPLCSIKEIVQEKQLTEKKSNLVLNQEKKIKTEKQHRMPTAASLHCGNMQ